MMPQCQNQLTERDIEKYIDEEKKSGRKKQIIIYAIIAAVIAAVAVAAFIILTPQPKKEVPKPIILVPNILANITMARDGSPLLFVRLVNVTGATYDAVLYDNASVLIDREVLPPRKEFEFSLPSYVYGDYIIKIQNTSGTVVEKNFSFKGDLSMRITDVSSIQITKSSNRYYLEPILFVMENPGSMSDIPKTGIPASPVNVRLKLESYEMNTNIASGKRWLWPEAKENYNSRKSPSYDFANMTGDHEATLQIFDTWGHILAERDVGNVTVP